MRAYWRDDLFHSEPVPATKGHSTGGLGGPARARARPVPCRGRLFVRHAHVRPQAPLRGAEPRGGRRQGVAGAGGRGRGAAGALRRVQPVRHVRPGQRRPGRGRRRRARAPGARRPPRPSLPAGGGPWGCRLRRARRLRRLSGHRSECCSSGASAVGPGVGVRREGPRIMARRPGASGPLRIAPARARTHVRRRNIGPPGDRPRRAGGAGAVCDRGRAEAALLPRRTAS
jgi:hypothetical protein